MNLLESLLALQKLEHLPRTGWAQRGVADPESIAAHVLGVCHVVMALAPRCEPPVDADRAVALAALHDAPEALLGDLPRTAAELLPTGAKRAAERAAGERLLGPFPEPVRERLAEALEGRTREARLVRLADRLQLGLRLVAYERAGRRGLEDFHRVLAELDCTGFPPAEELRRALLAELAGERPRG